MRRWLPATIDKLTGLLVLVPHPALITFTSRSETIHLSLGHWEEIVFAFLFFFKWLGKFKRNAIIVSVCFCRKKKEPRKSRYSLADTA